MKTVDQVSGTIRKLHSARARAESTRTYVKNLLDLNECADRVEKCMARGDFEEAKKRLEWYMSSQSMLAVEHRIDTEGKQGSDQRERILQCRDQLVEELRRSLKEIISGPAATKGATASICSSLTILGDSSTVRSQLGNHLRHQLVHLTEKALGSFRNRSHDDDKDERKQEENARLHETALSKLFNCVDRLTREHIESSRHRRLSSSSMNDDKDHAGTKNQHSDKIEREDNMFRQQLLVDMHKECDIQATRIVESYISCRRLRERSRDVS